MGFNISKDTLKRLINNYDGPDLANFLYEEMKKMAEIKSAILFLNQEKEKIKLDYDDKKKHLLNKIKEIQHSCKHWSVSFYGDPAGGNDSYHKCNYCGKEY